jgi:hypothetical protein
MYRAYAACTCGGESGWAMSLSELVLWWLLAVSELVLWWLLLAVVSIISVELLCALLSTMLAARDSTSSGDSGIPSSSLLAISITCNNNRSGDDNSNSSSSGSNKTPVVDHKHSSDLSTKAVLSNNNGCGKTIATTANNRGCHQTNHRDQLTTTTTAASSHQQ